MKTNPEEITYIDIRCPYENKSKSDDNIYLCNRICVQVSPGSKGKAKCRSCHLFFEFEVNSEAKITTGIRVKKVA